MHKIAVLGAGTWGSVVANLLSQNGNSVTVFARNSEQVKELNSTHRHKKLPYVVFDEKLKFSNDIDKTLDGAEIIVYAVPSTAFREIVSKTIKYIDESKYLISLTKGMEEKTLMTMSEIIEDELSKNNKKNDRIVVLSGPTHAEEVGRGFPTTIVSASKNEEAAKFVQDLCMNDRFRVYTNNDVKGVEICAAYKNIIALASGILTGLGFGDNIKAALITRGLAEMTRVGDALSCNKDTFYGLAGIGDMIVTATSEHSRNYQCGKLIGEGINPKEAVLKIGMVVEGINFLPKAKEISDRYNLDMPIASGTYEIVINGEAPKDILKLLMTRSKKAE